jgi:hypothetical protein
MKTLVLVLLSVTTLVLALAGGAVAAPRDHTCYVPAGTVTASGNTSCGFAWNITDAYVAGKCRSHQQCSGRAYSSARHRTYSIFCYGRTPVECDASGTTSWIRFFLT